MYDNVCVIRGWRKGCECVCGMKNQAASHQAAARSQIYSQAPGAGPQARGRKGARGVIPGPTRPRPSPMTRTVKPAAIGARSGRRCAGFRPGQLDRDLRSVYLARSGAYDIAA